MTVCSKFFVKYCSELTSLHIVNLQVITLVIIVNCKNTVNLKMDVLIGARFRNCYKVDFPDSAYYFSITFWLGCVNQTSQNLSTKT